MRKMITATGMALLSIGVVASVQAEPVSNAGQVTLAEAALSATTTATGPVAPIETAAAARRKGPKIKEKEAMDTSRVANPSTTGAPVADSPIVPIAAPAAARTGRPKEKEKTATDTSRVANPPTTTEPVAQPTERRRKGPKERDDDVSTRTGRPKERDPTPMDTSRTGGRPKERDDTPHDTSRTGGTDGSSTAPATTTPNPSGERAIRKNVVPKATSTKSRGSNLLLPALGGAAAIAAIIAATSGNDRPASP
jgi:hypothetical protein